MIPHTLSISSLARLASGCSTALLLWMLSRSLSSLPCLASGCSAVLLSWSRTHCLSSLACFTSACSACSDRLHSRSLWRQRCSLAVALSFRFRHNLSLALSRSIGIELGSEESIICVNLHSDMNCDPLSKNPAHCAFYENRDKTGNRYTNV